MDFDKRLLAPRHWPGWLGMAVGWLLALLPYPVQLWLGRRLGDLGYLTLPRRRRIAAVNLALCFPELNSKRRHALLRAHFQSAGMGGIETLICWWASDATIRRLSDPRGLHHLEAATAAGRGVILLSAHFTSLELGVRLAGVHLRGLGISTTAVYKAPHNAVVDYVMRRRRDTHIATTGERSILKNDIRGMFRALKRGRALWYAADQKATNKLSAVVPFFGHPAHTSLATSRLAALSGAAVVPFFTLRREDGRGYRLLVQPPLEDFPGPEPIADALRLNRLIEDVIRQAPAQYFWLHQRFRGPRVENPYCLERDG